MDETPVTNQDFAAFVTSSHYKTTAEKTPRPEDYPDVPPEALVAGSAVFSPPPEASSLADPYAWWRYAPGASWKAPDGKTPLSPSLAQHPVVHVSFHDAEAYCQARGKALPTEAEYEFAARGGLHARKYPWGDQLQKNGKWVANIWQGSFPTNNTGNDGFVKTSPVKSFPANSFGLYDMSGNVWQWCSDWYRPDYYAHLSAKMPLSLDPLGPSSSLDPLEPNIPKRSQKGGSFLCSDKYCTRYLVGSRGKGAPDSSSENLGFRCVKRPDKKRH
jgi:formylglycine-generating enzyme required for sulfatase activity